MRLALGLVTIFSFVLVAIFGFLPMDLHTPNGHGGCIAAVAQGIACPKNVDPIVSAVFHMDAFKGFSLASPELGGFAVMLVLLTIALLLALGGVFKPRSCIPARAPFRSKPSEHPVFSQQRLLIRWLALHENSPALLLGHR